MAKSKKTKKVEEQIEETIIETPIEETIEEQVNEIVEEPITEASMETIEEKPIELADKTNEFKPVEPETIKAEPTSFIFKHGELVFVNNDKSRVYTVISPCENGFYVLRGAGTEIYTHESMMRKLR